MWYILKYGENIKSGKNQYKGSVFMDYRYKTSGTCSKLIEFTVEDGILKNIRYTGGCSGNLQGIAKLVEGMKVEDVIEKLKGIGCGLKSTSCPDQLSRALEQVLSGERKGTN